VPNLLLSLALVLAAPAYALPLCDSAEKRAAFYAEMNPWRKALEQKRFADIDRKFNALIEETRAGKLTDQELNRWFEIFRQSNTGREPLHEDWIRAYPSSAAAHLALAYYYEGRGFSARSSEFSSNVSSAQFQAMGLEFRKAFDALARAEALMARPTLPASLRIWMHGVMGDGKGGRIEDMYRSALKAYPETVQVRVMWVTFSHPKWYGSVERLKAIPGDARTLSKEDQRYIQYLVMEELGSAYQHGEDYKRAADYYASAIPLCPGLDGALTKLMKMYQARKDFEALVPASTMYIERHPRNGWGYAMRGWAHLERKEWAEAARDYEKGATFGSSYAQEGLAWLVEWGRGVKHDYARAVELYETAAANGSTTAAAKAEKIRKATGLHAR
jgi:tetratricopeptide (TPR) repeat protein